MDGMWNDIAHLGVSAPDKIVRTVLVYAAVAVIVRLAGKRDLAQLNAFDLVVVLLLSNAVQNALIGPDNSVTGGVLGAAVLIAVNAVVVRLVRRNDTIALMLEGKATRLAEKGMWDRRALKREGLRTADLEAAVRRQGASSVADCDTVTIEPGGAIVTQLREDLMPPTQADLRRLEAKIDRLLSTEQR